MVAAEGYTVTPDLTAAVICVRNGAPQVLTVTAPDQDMLGLPAGPLTPEHKTLQSGLRSWVESQTGYRLGYVEQLYTFGDRAFIHSGRTSGDGQGRRLSIAYLALVSPVEMAPASGGAWRDWYSFFPWEDTRAAADTSDLMHALQDWAYAPRGQIRHERVERLNTCFGHGVGHWDEERALDRYELLYEAGVVQEAQNGGVDQFAGLGPGAIGEPMMLDHRRILATAMSRLRAKIKYRPVLFELMPPEFTLLQLQDTCESLSGVNLHKQNFRRLVTSQGLVEETGRISTATGGRPAKLMRFRGDVTAERPSPGVRVRANKKGGFP